MVVERIEIISQNIIPFHNTATVQKRSFIPKIVYFSENCHEMPEHENLIWKFFSTRE